MSVTVPSDRRFLRNQVHTPQRRRLRVRPFVRIARLLIVGGVLIAGGYWLVRTAVDQRWLRVQQLTVTGNQRVSTSEIEALVEGLKGDSLLSTDLDRWRSRLLASPWVAEATLRRRLPATIDVEIRERRPLGIARIGDELYLVDGSGTIDEFGPRYADLDLPMIDGLVVDTAAATPQIDRARAQTVGRLMADLRTIPVLARRVSQIDVSDAHDAHVILDGDSAVIRLGDAQFAERLQLYADVQATLRQRVRDIDYVDLRFGERVYVGPALGTTGAVVKPAATSVSRNLGERRQP